MPVRTGSLVTSARIAGAAADELNISSLAYMERSSAGTREAEVWNWGLGHLEVVSVPQTCFVIRGSELERKRGPRNAVKEPA